MLAAVAIGRRMRVKSLPIVGDKQAILTVDLFADTG